VNSNLEKETVVNRIDRKAATEARDKKTRKCRRIDDAKREESESVRSEMSRSGSNEVTARSKERNRCGKTRRVEAKAEQADIESNGCCRSAKNNQSVDALTLSTSDVDVVVVNVGRNNGGGHSRGLHNHS